MAPRASRVGLLALGGCVKKAAYVPDGHGGYLLQTQATSLDEAMERFQRTASGLCPNETTSSASPGRQAGGNCGHLRHRSRLLAALSAPIIGVDEAPLGEQGTNAPRTSSAHRRSSP